MTFMQEVTEKAMKNTRKPSGWNNACKLPSDDKMYLEISEQRKYFDTM